jgi:hypothetical protein
MTIWDKVLITVVLAAAIASGFLVPAAIGGNAPADTVIVKVDGRVRQRLPLNEDASLKIEGDHGFCRLEIKDGRARVTDADCPDKVCVSQGPVDAGGGVIACLPNKIVIAVEHAGEQADSYDAVVR